MRPAAALATRTSRALISASNYTKPTRSWSPSLEQTLHRLSLRDSLSPALVAEVIDPHLLTHHSLALGFFNWASQQPNFTHSSLSYQSVLKSLSLSRQFNAIDSVLKQVKVNKVTLDASVYCFIIRSLIQGKDTQKAFLVFTELKSKCEEIGPQICNSLLAALASDGYFESALKVFDAMTQRGVEFSTIGFGVFIWRFCKNVELGQVLSMLESVKRSCNSAINGSIIAVLIVHGLCEAKRVEEANRVLDELRIRECKPDFIAYRIVAEEFKLMGDVFERETVLKKKRKLGVAPRTSDYREFILGLISERRICEAKELGRVREAYMVLQEMKKKGLAPNVSFYNCLMEACCRKDLLRPAKKLWDEMFANGCSGNLKTYNTLIGKFSEAGEVEDALRLFHRMSAKGVTPDITTYMSLLKGLCQETNFQAAFEVFHKSVTQDTILAHRILSTLILSLCQNGHFLVAVKFLHGLAPDMGHSESHVILLKCLADAREIQVAIEHIKWLQKTSPSILQVIATELSALLSSLSQPEPILQLLQAVQENFLNSKSVS
ncbi:pentatricopeptide repeat-containing protein At5g14080 isoform X3 [Mangifera indica]|uniref:pentatricopeptide repeat-containing protein At5g14080 isoform X3 n=1 Tax=Mangifera indica TaxID=29780 RepID=UPI001CFA8ED9|nr:pentatricopeptide repeat-containing protein At5g14080 isoform X3 [Mangifera indica]